MALIPESGKPIDFDIDLVKTPEDARIVLEWLRDLITDMTMQILQHLTESNLNLDWLNKVRTAMRATVRLHGQVSEKRRLLVRSRAELFVEAATEIFDREDLDDVWKEVEQRLTTPVATVD